MFAHRDKEINECKSLFKEAHPGQFKQIHVPVSRSGGEIILEAFFGVFSNIFD